MSNLNEVEHIADHVFLTSYFIFVYVMTTVCFIALIIVLVKNKCKFNVIFKFFFTVYFVTLLIRLATVTLLYYDKEQGFEYYTYNEVNPLVMSCS